MYRHTFRNGAGALEEKEVLLTEEDEIWAETRHMHMKDALDKLVADFQKYAGEYEQKFGGEGKGINDMKDMLASLDATRKSKDSLSAHLDLAQKCMGYFEKQKLPIIAEVEQVCPSVLATSWRALPYAIRANRFLLFPCRAAQLASTQKARCLGPW
jgi:syntaxin-binding protein 1